MASSGSESYDPPDRNQFEVSIFGPGYGECIVAHVGENEWITVDSCIDPNTGTPIALAYFRAIGVDASVAVRVTIATHWDDDHIKGIADVYRAASSSTFVCSQALTGAEFMNVLSTWGAASTLPFGSGVDEFRSVMSELKQRAKNTRYPTPKFAAQDKALWGRIGSLPAEVKSLSPSDASFAAAIARFSEISEESDGIQRRMPRITDNHTSIVLSVRVCDVNVLLGADLQNRQDRSLGWFGVVDSHDGRVHDAWKIAHHGSANADCHDIWTTLLSPQPISVVTPYVRGRIRLPKSSDCARILSHTSTAFLTAPPIVGKLRLGDKAMEKAICAVAKSAHMISGKFGHVRLRRNIPSDSKGWEVSLFGDAISVATYLQRTAK